MRYRRYMAAFVRSRWIWLAAIPPVAWLAIALAVALSGCARTFDYWYRTGPPNTEPYLHVYTYPDKVDALCRSYGAVQTGPIPACTVRRYRFFIFPYNPSAFLVEHEEKHRAGYDHPVY